MGETRGHHVGESMNREAGALLDELLASLLDDFEHWFQRGEELLQNCPDAVMAPEERQGMEGQLKDGRKAVSMAVMNPWHGLVTEVWALAAKLGSSRSRQAPS